MKPLHTALLFVAACTSTEDDWLPNVSTGEGKADAVTSIPGSSIPSAYVDPNLDYLIARRIGSLQQVGLSSVAISVALRVDGIIANMPTDGQLHVAELVKMEQPDLFASLFPDEQAALPLLWHVLEEPVANDH